MGERWGKCGRNMEERWGKCGRNMEERWGNVVEIWKKGGGNVVEIWKKGGGNVASANNVEFQYSIDQVQDCLHLEFLPRARRISARLQGRHHR
jgi:hypothetical protein